LDDSNHIAERVQVDFIKFQAFHFLFGALGNVLFLATQAGPLNQSLCKSHEISPIHAALP
jgi:hypothetical protein